MAAFEFLGRGQEEAEIGRLKDCLKSRGTPDTRFAPCEHFLSAFTAETVEELDVMAARVLAAHGPEIAWIEVHRNGEFVGMFRRMDQALDRWWADTRPKLIECARLTAPASDAGAAPAAG